MIRRYEDIHEWSTATGITPAAVPVIQDSFIRLEPKSGTADVKTILMSDEIVVSFDSCGPHLLLHRRESVPCYRVSLLLRLSKEEANTYIHLVQERWERDILQAMIEGTI